MVRAGTLIEAIGHALRNSDQLSDDVTVVTQELDVTGSDASVSLPVVECMLTTVDREHTHNTEFVGWEYDDDGRKIGRLFEEQFSMEATIDVTTVQGSQTDVRTLLSNVQTALAPYETAKTGVPLPAPPANTDRRTQNAGNPISPTRFERRTHVSEHDFATSSTLRVRRLQVGVQFEHVLSEVDLTGKLPRLESIDVPYPGDATEADEANVIDLAR